MYKYIYEYTNVFVDEKLKRDTILQFINKNRGCKAEDIVDGVKDIMSRKIVFETLKTLTDEDIIKDEKTNRRDHKYFPNKNNELFIVKEQLIEFKDKFFRLLEKTQEHPVIIDALKEIEKERNIPDYKKVKSIEAMEKHMYYYEQSTRLYQNKTDMVDSLFKVNIHYFDTLLQTKTYPDVKFPNAEEKFSETEIKKIDKSNQETISKISEYLERYSKYVNKSGYITLIAWPVYIFITLVYLCSLKTIAKWPGFTRRKDVITNLNKLMFEDILELNIKLMEFISNNTAILEMPEFVENLVGSISVDDQSHYIQMYTDYSILDMEKEILNVIKSLNSLRNREIIYTDEQQLNVIKNTPKRMLTLINLK